MTKNMKRLEKAVAEFGKAENEGGSATKIKRKAEVAVDTLEKKKVRGKKWTI